MLLGALPLTVLGLPLAVLSLTTPERPNVVVLFSDDAGYADFGFQPDCAPEMRALTPHIDSIARDGARFTSAYMCGSVCSPSRAGLMTGRHPQRFGYDNNLPPGTQSGLELGETFGAARFQELGYTTALVGKWHLGYPAAYHPNERGFDRFFGLLQGSRSYFPIEDVSPARVLQDNGEPRPEEGYVTDRLGDAACRFIDAHADEPFFLFVSFTAPHSPNQPRAEDAERIAHIPKRRRRNYAGLVVSLDDNVGKILAKLHERGLDERTLVLFTNDNGGQTQTGAVNTPLRGRKGQLLEGGVRVPWAMRWPGHIAAGSVIDEPVSSLDLVPTFVELGGGAVDPAWELDGRSLVPLLAPGVAARPDRPLYWRQGGSSGPRAVRHGRWKLLDTREEGAAPALFDLARDIGEARDLAAREVARVATMLALLDEWERELEEPRWGPGAVRAPAAGSGEDGD